MDVLVCDIESGINSFCIGFMDVDTLEVKVFEIFGDVEKSLNDSDIREIKELITNNRIITFNGKSYDLPMIYLSLLGLNIAQLCNATQTIISERLKEYEIKQRFKLKNMYKRLVVDHVDLLLISPTNESLKLCGGRMYSDKLQDLPYAWSKELSREEWDKTLDYNVNDLILTKELYFKLYDDIQLRYDLSKLYKIPEQRLLKGSAGVAVEIIDKLVGGIEKPAYSDDYSFRYKAPDCVSFKSDKLKSLKSKIENHDFRFKLSKPIKRNNVKLKNIKTLELKKEDLSYALIPVNEAIGIKAKFKDTTLKSLLTLDVDNELNFNGELINVFITENINNKNSYNLEFSFYSRSVELPDFLKDFFYLDGIDLPFKFGIGGIHSHEKSISHSPNLIDTRMRTIDVTSYYPHLYVIYGFTPSHVDKETFTKVLSNIYTTRVKAKHGGRKGTPDDLGNKLILNASFGAMGDQYSKIFDPLAMIHVTLTGQLMLMMLIEELVKVPTFKICSTNTDGIEYLCQDDYFDDVKLIVDSWEYATSLQMEHEEYLSLNSANVNNYIAVYDGKKGKYAKRKGAYAPSNLGINPSYEVVYDAVATYLCDESESIEDYIHNCKDYKKFTVVTKVTGGACIGGQFIPNEKQPKKDSDGNIEYKVIPKHKCLKMGLPIGTLDYDNPKMELVKNKDGTKGTHTGQYLGKVVRFYYTPNGYDITRKDSGNKVSEADNCIDLMQLSKIDLNKYPIDYERYIKLAYKHLTKLGVNY